MRWREEDLEVYRSRRAGAPANTAPDRAPRASKFNARRTLGRSGRTYDSALEARRAGELAVAARAGEIRALREQVPYPLTDGAQRPYLIRSPGYP